MVSIIYIHTPHHFNDIPTWLHNNNNKNNIQHANRTDGGRHVEYILYNNNNR